MKLFIENELSTEERRSLLRRPIDFSIDNIESVRQICIDVKQRGDRAVVEYTLRFDQISLETFRLSSEQKEEASSIVGKTFLEALQIAATNIRAFHEAQQRSPLRIETMPGITCWREVCPIETVGLYVPAGSAPLPSTVLMLGIPALLAGCHRIVLCSPPRANGKVDPYVLAAANIIGINEIYSIGGAQAIAALAYGTESIPKVDKIFGPGNRYVTAAKFYVSIDPDGASIDMLAGPSEVLIIADEHADPEIVALDCISQAEHDADAQAVLLTPSRTLAEAVVHLVPELAKQFSRNEIIECSLQKSFAMVTASLEQAIVFSNEYAPEHLILNVRNAESLVSSIRNAGSVFVGPFAPVTAGDYASGTNHTLPTSGMARWFSGLSLESFQKTITFQSLTKDGLHSLAPTLLTMASAEGLEAHGKAVSRRL